MNLVEIYQGECPIILCMPHTGTWVPQPVLDAFNSTGRQLADTDWHIDKLYDGLLPEATTVRAVFHRYLIDANRDPSGTSLYPEQNTTGLCPIIDFEGNPIYQDGRQPDPAEIVKRREQFHRSYHASIEQQIERLRAKHPVVVVYDCHSIRSQLPFLFPGVLPDFNIGTNQGKTCAAAFENKVDQICQQAAGYTSVRNGRFVGGWTTRHYGQPAQGVHAIQMEICQSTYMTEHAPWDYSPERADITRQHLARALHSIQDVIESGELAGEMT